MKKYSEENVGYVYLLKVIDTFSTFAWAIPIKKKDGVTVSKAFRKIIKSAKSQNHKPHNLLHTDKEATKSGFIGILQNLLDEYNFKDKRRSIGITPSEVNKSNENLVLRTLFKQSNKKKSKIKFQVGDSVTITRFKYTFSNKYDPNWTRSIYIIKETLNTQPVTYKIKDLNDEEIIGAFYNEELQKIIF